MTLYSPEALYCRKQIDRFHRLWGGKTLAGSLRNRLGGLIWGETTVGPELAGAIAGALKEKRPFSLIRVGDGEGNVLGCLDPDLDAQTELAWFNRTFASQTGISLPLPKALEFARQMEKAALSATVLGVRSLMFWVGLEEGQNASLQMSEDCLANGDLRGCLGILRAEDQVLRWAEAVWKRGSDVRGVGDPSISGDQVRSEGTLRSTRPWDRVLTSAGRPDVAQNDADYPCIARIRPLTPSKATIRLML